MRQLTKKFLEEFEVYLMEEEKMEKYGNLKIILQI